ncbi:Putative SKP1/BTB/POZ domain superfamily protein [Septoria linicola]|uniref:SKP1/BTB/POZ domain superfamily protein n=1 Tax=Septoria linicola TaxID=215465 RepID=A0A9Q9EPL7_9PEZI|nr:Putative SKP1/BTB/POZ domain superfamily protein [Septoria linicola]
MSLPRTEGILKRLYRSGGFSDLALSTVNETWHVHRCIVCEASFAFYELWFNVSTDRLLESNWVVEQIMAHCYGVADILILTTIEGRLEGAVELYLAAIKYDLPELRDEVEAVIAGIEGPDQRRFIEYLTWLYRHPQRNELPTSSLEAGAKLLASGMNWWRLSDPGSKVSLDRLRGCHEL